MFKVSNSVDVSFVDMIVAPGDITPEGLAVYRNRGHFYVVIDNEAAVAGGVPNTPSTVWMECSGNRHTDRARSAVMTRGRVSRGPEVARGVKERLRALAPPMVTNTWTR